MLFNGRVWKNRLVEKALHFRKDPGTLLLHVGTCCALVGFSLSDQLHLRAGSMISGLASVFFNLTRVPKVVAPVYWSAAFFSANVYNVYLIFMDRRDCTLTEDEEKIYVNNFKQSGMRPIQFKHIYDNGKINHFDKDEDLSTKKNKVWLLINGELEISVDDEPIATISDEDTHAFVGEVDLLNRDFTHPPAAIPTATSPATDKKTTKSPVEVEELKLSSISNTKTRPHARVCIKVTSETVSALEWDESFLFGMLHEKSESAIKLHNVLLTAILRKLKHNNQAAHQHTYSALLSTALEDGKIDVTERKMLKHYREHHAISDAYQSRCLAKYGWSDLDYSRGYKTKSWVLW